ncbi:TIGR02680 family protein, partial [Streptomyces anthocyanicus]
QALHDKVGDAYLRPLPPAQRPTGRTLADVLVVEDQQLVSAAAVQAVLASVAVTDDVPATDGALRAPAVTTGSHFCLGIQVGAHPKDQPEYIGATARAARRRERLRLLEESIAVLEAQLAGIEEQQRYAQEACDDFDRARHELPRTQPIIQAVGQVAVVAEKAAGARRRLSEARKRLDGAIARAHEKNRQLRHAATAARLPTLREELDNV